MIDQAAFRESWHCLWIETGALQNLNPDAVRFLFVLLRKGDHALLRTGQCTGERRHPGLRACHG